jgi:hypothetical protein
MDEMQDEDYKVSSCGNLGGKTQVAINGNVIAEFVEESEAYELIKERMEKEQFWPNIFWISDHGNIMQVDSDGNEVKHTV